MEVMSPAPTPPSTWATRCRWTRIPLGTLVHNVELQIGQAAGRWSRSRRGLRPGHGQGRRARHPAHAFSGEVRMVHRNCYATIGEVGNSEHENVVSGKAGRYSLARPSVPRCVVWP